MCQIPHSTPCKYRQIGQKIDYPKAFQAVGNANNHNPILILIPCHRVIGSNHQLVGYALGLDIKNIY